MRELMNHFQVESIKVRSGRPILNRSFPIGRTAVFALTLLSTVSGVWPCSGVGPIGKPVVFGDQTNIVIWDEAHHMEHFIRNATFKSGAQDFGFIAPTPGKPELSKASNKAFYTLASLAPVVAYSARASASMKEDRVVRAKVEVIQEADVSGYHATTLKCPDAHAINDWMNAHGYVSTPEVEKWAERYCTRGWYLTAFKVIDRSKLIASTGTVRMSFPTNHPYNPFYVPKTNIPINGGGTLRVYFVSVGNYDSQIGRPFRRSRESRRAETSPVERWQTPQWTTSIPEASAALLAKQVELPFNAVPDNSQVELFVDYNFPRPAAEDIYFVKRKVAETTKPKPMTASPINSDSYILSIFGCVGLFTIGASRTKKQSCEIVSG